VNSIHGGTLITPDGPTGGHIHLQGGKIIAVAPTDDAIDTNSSIVSPGLIDIQTNGGWGHDFTADPSTIWEVGAMLPSTGVTAFLPTIVTAPYEVSREAIAVVSAGPPADYEGASVLGLHIEGPWISPDWKGAHIQEHLRSPDKDIAAEWAVSGAVVMVTLAPELEDATEVANILSRSGVVVSAGHSGADYSTAESALDGAWGAVTHLYNQMSGFDHRAPGLVAAALNSDRPCGVIVDGLHSASGALQLGWNRLGPDRMILITDSMAATGLGEGSYSLGDLDVTVGPDGPRTPDGRLAGSVLTMDAAVRNLSQWTTATFPEAVTSASTTPAETIGASSRGRLEHGADADIAIFDPDGNVEFTLIGGRVVYEASRD
jgi:N-acetylglucosamine-6-phosphate deacetylase